MHRICVSSSIGPVRDKGTRTNNNTNHVGDAFNGNTDRVKSRAEQEDARNDRRNVRLFPAFRLRSARLWVGDRDGRFRCLDGEGQRDTKADDGGHEKIRFARRGPTESSRSPRRKK